MTNSAVGSSLGAWAQFAFAGIATAQQRIWLSQNDSVHSLCFVVKEREVDLERLGTHGHQKNESICEGL